MLDHTNIKTTQLYARITDQKIGGNMDNLAAKIGGQPPTPPEPSEWSPDSDTGPFSSQETQNGRPSRIAVLLEMLIFAVR